MKLHTVICLVLISAIFCISSCSTDNSGNQKENLEMKPIKTDSNMQSEGNLNSNTIESKESESKEERLYYIPKEVKLEKLDSLVFDIADSGEYNLIFTLKDNDSTYLGDLYGNPRTDTVYTSLFIARTTDNNLDTLYVIDENKFMGLAGPDLEMDLAGFYGFLFAIKKPNYFVIHRLDNGGKNISDGVTVEWDNSNELFRTATMP